MTRIVSVIVLVVAVLATPGWAQEPFPTRPITIVAPFPPGGLADMTARPLASVLERIVKQPVVVMNKPGAGSAVGNHFVATSKPDGYTLLLALPAVSTLPEVDKLFGRPPKYTVDHLVGIARINAEPSTIVVRGETPWKTVKDLVEDGRTRPNQIIHTSTGIYGASHVPFVMFLHAAGITMRHVPMNGGGPMLNALLGGHAEVTASTASVVAGHIPAGKVRLLAHTGVGRLPAFPDIPSLKELGYEVEYYVWAGLLAPKATPAHIVKILDDAVRQAVKDRVLVAAMDKIQTRVAYQDAKEFEGWWRKDAERQAAIIKAIGKIETR